ncbi:hypothetical protein [Pseudooceanicola algae]|uniref:Uncharacterized protein n=1 Tax=Pseudooceanicola algae TaxID=1537215 RepID=A0A418SFB1_9RHOB|nr:hypothetical protein [Pseudooceanicola algae]QPM89223.1 hypothetical protein PSAL_004380 [Pseudooceanicola algae]
MFVAILTPYLPLVVALIFSRLGYALLRGRSLVLSLVLPLLCLGAFIGADALGQGLPYDGVLMASAIAAMLGSLLGLFVALIVGIFTSRPQTARYVRGR